MPKAGADRYSIMRELKTDDLVIHFSDGNIVGWSRIATPFQEVKEAPACGRVGRKVLVLSGSSKRLSTVSEIDADCRVPFT